MSKIKENKGLRGDVLEYVAQASQQFDTEIGQKDHFRMETSTTGIAPPAEKVRKGHRRERFNHGPPQEKYAVSVLKIRLRLDGGADGPGSGN